MYICLYPGESGLPAVVDLAPVSDCYDENEQHVVVDLVDDPVVAGAYSPVAVSADEFPGSARLGLGCQQFDRGLNAPLHGMLQLAQLSDGRNRNLDLVGHVRPRSALT